jgi:molybdate transport system regulatory protein
MSSRSPDRPAIRPRVYLGPDVALGPGKIDLLQRIDVEKSISGAARAMGMSYTRAWQLVDAMNRDFGPVVTTATGGTRGGGASLTATGHALVAAYRALEARLNRCSTREIARLSALLAKPRRR